MPRNDVGALIAAVQRRRQQLDIVTSLSIGFAVFAVADVFTPAALAAILGIVVSGAMLVVRRPHWTAFSAARAIERARPGCRNLVITAEELQRHPERATGWMAERVAADALRATGGLRAGDVVAASRTLAGCAVAVVIAAGLVVLPRTGPAQEAIAEVARATVDRVLGRTGGVTVVVHPPAYAGTPAATLRDPERVDVLEGSRLVFSFGTAGATLRFGGRSIGTFGQASTLEATARESGYFAIEVPGTTDARRLIALAVRRDAAPTVKIEQPAKDLLLPVADRTIPLKISAGDDLALSSLELRYTKVSGAGESFEFQEGTVPLRIARGSGREWQADAELVLRALKLGAGESLVYRAVARDARPGDAGLGTSDTFFGEVAGPGQIALEGVEMPPHEERYALSQQMIVLKIERLKARQASLTREELVEQTALLAAEQRTVRANFIFLLGGHVEDEEVEAEQSHEIAEGRLEHTARRDINRAIGDMTRAEQGLVAVDTGAALPPARAAVQSLQRAFGRARYLLRTLPVRSRIDPSRRLTGTLAGAATWGRRPQDAPPRPGDGARWVLAELHVLAAAIATRATIEPQAIDQLAETALAVDPGHRAWQTISRDIAKLRTATQDPDAATAALRRLIPVVAAEAAKGLIPQTPLARPQSALERAWSQGR